MTFNTLTMIDPVTNLLEIVLVEPTKTSAETANMLETTWLSHYPRPSKVVWDKGPEFVGFEWDDLLTKVGIKKSFITSRNPQSNSLIERSHQAISQVIRVLVALRPPSNANEGDKLIDTAFATAMHASRCASNSQLNFYSPGALVFHHDMFLGIPLHADLILLNKFRQNKSISTLKSKCQAHCQGFSSW